MPHCLLYAALLVAIAVPQPPPAMPDAPAAAPVPTANKALVTVQITGTPADPRFETFLRNLPDGPVQIDPDVLQSTLAAATAPVATDTPLATKLRIAYLKLTPQQRLNNEPVWKYGINPILWVNRTKGTTLDWWRSNKTTLSPERLTISEVYPVRLR
jgi:hypothetical protein